MSPTYDVIAIGLGGMGSAAAHQLSARGARTRPGEDRPATRMYSRTPDEHFVIARHPARLESVTAAAELSGRDFTFVPVVGGIVAGLARTGTTAHPIDLFDPSRLAAAPA